MKFTISTAVALLAASASALSVRSEDTRTVAFTNEQTGHSQSAHIPGDKHPVSVPEHYPELYKPFHVDSVMITSGVVEGAWCKVAGKSFHGDHVDVLEVNGRQNYARWPAHVDVDPYTLTIACD
ncbi:hypothetical protein BDW62DRAFT_202699 [Aspergillus aurantiobrunneus]